jgi:hypothetical protein
MRYLLGAFVGAFLLICGLGSSGPAPAYAAECDTAWSHEQAATCQMGGPATLTNKSPTNLTTTAAQIAAANPARATLSIQNLDASINVCYSFVSTTPVCGNAGTFIIQPMQVFAWSRGDAPASALYMIAASGTPKVSVYEGQ